MRRTFPLLPAVLLLSLAACTTLPPVEPSRVWDPPVMGQDTVALERFLDLALARNPALGRPGWTEVWEAYRDACQTEGVSQAVALAQMILETNALRFGGTVRPEQNNFAGLGTVDKNTPGLSFPDLRTGALAQVQHLKAYASTASLTAASVDPRFRYVKRGSAPTVRALAGRWAADPAYGDKLVSLWQKLHSGT
jgi:hypothetical protein